MNSRTDAASVAPSDLEIAAYAKQLEQKIQSGFTDLDELRLWGGLSGSALRAGMKQLLAEGRAHQEGYHLLPGPAPAKKGRVQA